MKKVARQDSMQDIIITMMDKNEIKTVAEKATTNQARNWLRQFGLVYEIACIATVTALSYWKESVSIYWMQLLTGCVLIQLYYYWRVSIKRSVFSFLKQQDGELEQILNGLKNNTLTTIKNVNTKLSLEDVEKISELIKKNKSLITLNLYGKRLGDKGLICVANAVKFNSSVRYLYLSTNEIHDAGVIGLCEAIKQNDSLREIGLSNNNISDVGFTKLIKACESKKIQAIYIHQNPVYDVKSVEVLLHSLKFNLHLFDFDLYGLPVWENYLAARMVFYRSKRNQRVYFYKYYALLVLLYSKHSNASIHGLLTNGSNVMDLGRFSIHAIIFDYLHEKPPHLRETRKI